MNIEQPKVIDLLDSQQGPALSSTTDMPVIETKPDAQNEGAPPAVEPEKEPEQPSESATEATEEPDGQPAEPRGVGKRLAQLVKQREEAEAKANQEREARIRIEERLKLLEEAKPAQVAPKDDEPARPNKADFSDPDTWELAMLDYAERRAGWAAQKEVKRLEEEAQKKAEATAAEEVTKKTIEAFNQRITKTKEKYPDFDEVINTPDVKVSQAITHVIVNSEHGPDLQYYLGKHPEEAAKLLDLPAADQLIEAGLIIAKMRNPVQPISAAPKPINPVRSGDRTSVEKDPEKMSTDEYAVYFREREKANRMRH